MKKTNQNAAAATEPLRRALPQMPYDHSFETENGNEELCHMSKMKISPRGSSWDDFERQMYTPEEIEASKVRSEIITEMIKAREEGVLLKSNLKL